MVNDWPLITIGDCFDFKNGLNKEKEFFGHGNPIINYMDVYKNNSIHSDDIKGKVELSDNEIRRYEVRRGDVFFTRTSETPEEVGLSAVLLDNVENCTFSGFVLRARPKNDWLMPEYCKYCFSTEFVRKSIIEGCTYTTRALTNGTQLSKIQIPLPSKCEQQAIVRVLSDIDNLISTQEALIAKKQAIKQGAMQKLLTGKRRLVKFKQGQKFQNTEVGRIPFDWKVLSLKECCVGSLHYGVNAPAIPYDEKYPCYVRITDITDEGKYSNSDRVSVRVGFDSEFILKENDICLARTGASTGKSYLYNILDGTMVYAGFLICASIDSTIANADYIFNQLHTNRYWSWVKAVSQRSGQPGINGREYGDLLLPMPSLEEQIEIAEVLQDMDRDIVNQQAKLEKLRRIKSGMMDKLLTGKIRLTD